LKSAIILDDNVSWCETLSGIVNNHLGFNVIATAHSGRESKLLIEHYRPSLVYMDIIMPDDDGLQVIKHIRKLDDYDPFIYVITGMETPAIKAMLEDLNVDFIDFKPVEYKAIIDRLNYVATSAQKECNVYDQGMVKVDTADIVEDVLQEFGVPFHLCGYEYIKTALYFMIDDPGVKRNVYTKVALIFECSYDSVKKNIRTAIEPCMSSEAYAVFFGDERAENMMFLNQLTSIIRKRLRGSGGNDSIISKPYGRVRSQKR